MEINLGDAASGPVYLQVRQQIETHIQNGALAVGANLPAPSALAAKLGVDRGEIQRAYFELEQFGKVSKKVTKDFLGGEKTTYTVKSD